MNTLEQKLLRSGYQLGEIIGCGHNGCAYSLKNSQNVLKITKDHNEAKAMALLIGLNHKNLVHVSNVWRYKSDNETFYIEQEKLSPFDLDLYQKNIRGLTSYFESINDYGEKQLEKRSQLMKKYDALNNRQKKFVSDMEQAAIALHDLGIFFEDFHDGNIMKRGSDYVIIDLGYSRSKGKVEDIREATIHTDISFVTKELSKHKNEFTSELSSLDIIKLLNDIFEQYDIFFDIDSRISESGNLAEVGIVESYIDERLNINVLLNYEIYDLIDDNYWFTSFLRALSRLIHHELVHREQIVRSNKVNKVDMSSNLSYLSDKREIMAHAQEAVDEFLNIGYTREQIIKKLHNLDNKNVNPDSAESDAFFKYVEHFDYDDPVMKLFLKYVYDYTMKEKLTEQIKKSKNIEGLDWGFPFLPKKGYRLIVFSTTQNSLNDQYPIAYARKLHYYPYLGGTFGETWMKGYIGFKFRGGTKQLGISEKLYFDGKQKRELDEKSGKLDILAKKIIDSLNQNIIPDELKIAQQGL